MANKEISRVINLGLVVAGLSVSLFAAGTWVNTHFKHPLITVGEQSKESLARTEAAEVGLMNKEYAFVRDTPGKLTPAEEGLRKCMDRAYRQNVAIYGKFERIPFKQTALFTCPDEVQEVNSEDGSGIAEALRDTWANAMYNFEHQKP